MLMSKSKIIIASAGSTFSLWAGFVSDAALILHPDHIHAPIRPSSLHTSLYEGAAIGAWETWNPLLIHTIGDIANGVDSKARIATRIVETVR